MGQIKLTKRLLIDSFILLIHFAVEGSNADFTIAAQSFEVVGPDARTPAELTTFIRIDGVALEPPEDIILTMVGRNNAGRAILAPTTPGHFVFSTLRVIIEDVEGKFVNYCAFITCNWMPLWMCTC